MRRPSRQGRKRGVQIGKGGGARRLQRLLCRAEIVLCQLLQVDLVRAAEVIVQPDAVQRRLHTRVGSVTADRDEGFFVKRRKNRPVEGICYDEIRVLYEAEELPRADVEQARKPAEDRTRGVRSK